MRVSGLPSVTQSATRANGSPAVNGQPLQAGPARQRPRLLGCWLSVHAVLQHQLPHSAAPLSQGAKPRVHASRHASLGTAPHIGSNESSRSYPPPPRSPGGCTCWPPPPQILQTRQCTLAATALWQVQSPLTRLPGGGLQALCSMSWVCSRPMPGMQPPQNVFPRPPAAQHDAIVALPSTRQVCGASTSRLVPRTPPCAGPGPRQPVRPRCPRQHQGGSVSSAMGVAQARVELPRAAAGWAMPPPPPLRTRSDQTGKCTHENAPGTLRTRTHSPGLPPQRRGCSPLG
jgi:hypothetical protein